MDKKGWANARDHYGHSALHKSVMANQGDIMKFLLHHHPEHIEDRDNVSSQLIECLVGFQISLAGCRLWPSQITVLIKHCFF